MGGSYRDDLDAIRARNEALEDEIRELEAHAATLEALTSGGPTRVLPAAPEAVTAAHAQEIEEVLKRLETASDRADREGSLPALGKTIAKLHRATATERARDDVLVPSNPRRVPEVLQPPMPAGRMSWRTFFAGFVFGVVALFLLELALGIRLG